MINTKDEKRYSSAFRVSRPVLFFYHLPAASRNSRQNARYQSLVSRSCVFIASATSALLLLGWICNPV
ncbi:hypothetical protein HYPSUDRAFT_361136 [Hypholoma sublateritium FD-334 SS-4]|uniref:Uncharacterized protein n=1 Tax=Hypholoma sublateritium (strain FD-334 SS-4) TaxID=945553 RepID=A0A0D2P557_HYPSF|nr:hypothetical protein HYPSUDRAFT_361136 [Hypholoma sublateritium FD-334 SS-4]